MRPAIVACTALLCLLSGLPRQTWAHSDASMFGTPAAAGHHPDHEGPAERLHPARVLIDPRRMEDVVIKISARIVNLRNVYVGKKVSRGEILGEMESAELETVQNTYLGLFNNMDAVQAFSMTSGEKMVDARMNLLWRGMTEEDVKLLENTRQPLKRVKIRASSSGYLYSLNVVNNQILNIATQGGQYATGGTTIATIAKPEAIVVEASLPAREAATIKPGQAATVYATDRTGRRVKVSAQVQRIYAFVNPVSQRQWVRLKLAGGAGYRELANGGVVTVGFQEAAHDHDH